MPLFLTPAVPPAGGQKVFDPTTSSLIAGQPDDAKFYRVGFTILPGQTLIIDPLVGMRVFFDVATANPGLLFISLDTCFGEMSVTQGLFFGARLFRKVTLRLDPAAVAADGIGSMIVSRNPEFFVIQGRG